MSPTYFLHLLLFVSASAIADVNEMLVYKAYYVNHKAGDSLLASLNKSSHVRDNGYDFHGMTTSHINWDLWWKVEQNGQCYITNVKVNLVTEIALPELITSDTEIKNVFSKFLDALRRHELGHFVLAQTMAKKIDEGILALPVSKSCSLLVQSANQIGNQLVEKLKRENEKYDESTQHGRTQGVSLPGQYPINQASPCEARWCKFIRSLFDKLTNN